MSSAVLWSAPFLGSDNIYKMMASVTTSRGVNIRIGYTLATIKEIADRSDLTPDRVSQIANGINENRHGFVEDELLRYLNALENGRTVLGKSHEEWVQKQQAQEYQESLISHNTPPSSAWDHTIGDVQWQAPLMTDDRRYCVRGAGTDNEWARSSTRLLSPHS